MESAQNLVRSPRRGAPWNRGGGRSPACATDTQPARDEAIAAGTRRRRRCDGGSPRASRRGPGRSPPRAHGTCGSQHRTNGACRTASARARAPACGFRSVGAGERAAGRGRVGARASLGAAGPAAARWRPGGPRRGGGRRRGPADASARTRPGAGGNTDTDTGHPGAHVTGPAHNADRRQRRAMIRMCALGEGAGSDERRGLRGVRAIPCMDMKAQRADTTLWRSTVAATTSTSSRANCRPCCTTSPLTTTHAHPSKYRRPPSQLRGSGGVVTAGAVAAAVTGRGWAGAWWVGRGMARRAPALVCIEVYPARLLRGAADEVHPAAAAAGAGAGAGKRAGGRGPARGERGAGRLGRRPGGTSC